jgi:hypothetical protein
MSQTTIGIPRVLWESLETTLWTHSRKYVRDLAKYLGIKEDVLLKEVLPSKDTLKVYIQDCPEDIPHDMECRALIKGGGSFAFRCRKTIQLGSVYCCAHHLRRQDIQPAIGEQTHRLYRIVYDAAEDAEALPPLWVDERGSVWNADAQPRGYYDKESMQLYLFE